MSCRRERPPEHSFTPMLLFLSIRLMVNAPPSLFFTPPPFVKFSFPSCPSHKFPISPCFPSPVVLPPSLCSPSPSFSSAFPFSLPLPFPFPLSLSLYRPPFPFPHRPTDPRVDWERGFGKVYEVGCVVMYACGRFELCYIAHFFRWESDRKVNTLKLASY